MSPKDLILWDDLPLDTLDEFTDEEVYRSSNTASEESVCQGEPPKRAKKSPAEVDLQVQLQVPRLPQDTHLHQWFHSPVYCASE